MADQACVAMDAFSTVQLRAVCPIDIGRTRWAWPPRSVHSRRLKSDPARRAHRLERSDRPSLRERSRAAVGRGHALGSGVRAIFAVRFWGVGERLDPRAASRPLGFPRPPVAAVSARAPARGPGVAWHGLQRSARVWARREPPLCDRRCKLHRALQWCRCRRVTSVDCSARRADADSDAFEHRNEVSVPKDAQ